MQLCKIIENFINILNGYYKMEINQTIKYGTTFIIAIISIILIGAYIYDTVSVGEL